MPISGHDLVTALKGRESVPGEEPDTVELRWISRRELAVRPSVGGKAGDEFTLEGRMRRGMFVYKNDIERSGIPLIYDTMSFSQAALGKTETGSLVVLRRSGGWGRVLFIPIIGVSVGWTLEYPVYGAVFSVSPHN